MRGERYARGRDLEVVGFYHSHPDSPAVPSQYDLEHAWPTYSYIIVSVSAEQANDLFSWEQEADRSRFNSEAIGVHINTKRKEGTKRLTMAVTISIPAPLRQFAAGQSQITVEAKTAGEALDLLTSTHSALRKPPLQ